MSVAHPARISEGMVSKTTPLKLDKTPMDINNFGKTVSQKVGILNDGVVSHLA